MTLAIERGFQKKKNEKIFSNSYIKAYTAATNYPSITVLGKNTCNNKPSDSFYYSLWLFLYFLFSLLFMCVWLFFLKRQTRVLPSMINVIERAKFLYARTTVFNISSLFVAHGTRWIRCWWNLSYTCVLVCVCYVAFCCPSSPF